MSKKLLIVIIIVAVAAIAYAVYRNMENDNGTVMEDEDGNELVVRGANVDDIEVVVLATEPVQVRVIASGNLPDGCTTIQSKSAKLNGKTFELEIKTRRPKDAICTQALVAFEETITLDVMGLSAGTYTVQADELTKTFVLAEDNIAPGK